MKAALSRRALLTASLGLPLLLTSCNGKADHDEVSTKPQPTSGSAGPQAAAVAHCDGSWPGSYAQTEGESIPPECVDGTWQFVLPTVPFPPTRRRSELWLRRPTADSYKSGDVVNLALAVRASLGDAAKARRNWHVLMQLHGPVRGEWRGPAVALVEREGVWSLAGGSGHPQHGVDGRNYAWEQTLGRFQEAKWNMLRLTVKLSSDPSVALLSANWNGEQIASDYRPKSPDGFSPGTIYPGQDYLNCRVGLYRGSDESSSPAYPQTAQHIAVLYS